MALEPGTRFGSYEVTESVGSGGMGEVWRATDTDLKRDVALKVPPEAFVSDADRLARFQREAEILALLNHPNIAQVYGLEKPTDRRPSSWSSSKARPWPIGSRTGLLADGDLWVYDLRGRPPIPLAVANDNRFPAWSPDGLEVAFVTVVNGPEIFRLPSDGSVLAPERLGPEELRAGPYAWSAAGSFSSVIRMCPIFT